MQEKILALSLYKQCHSGYSFLRELFMLPSNKTLQLLLQKIPLRAGINNIIFKHLFHQQSLLKDVKDKLCILMWDEIALQPQLQYDKVNNKIIGFEDWGHKRTQRIGDHALVFMLRGIRTAWKIPLSYNFCKSQTKSAELIRCIKEIVHEVTQAGFTIIATVCDQGSSNVSALNELLNYTKGICLKNGKEFGKQSLYYDMSILYFNN